MDATTSFAVAVLIDNKSSEEVATKLFKTWYGRSLPRIKSCHSDNGREFTGKAFQTMHTIFSTRTVKTISYHPASNGMVERVHCLIDQLMDNIMEANPRLPEHLALVWAAGAYNGAPMTTGFSPQQLAYGIINVDLGIESLDVYSSQEISTDHTYRFLKDNITRQQAIEAHLEFKNGAKIRQMIQRKSRPVPSEKPLGSWVWVWRNGEYIGIGQVCNSLGYKCAVKMTQG